MHILRFIMRQKIGNDFFKSTVHYRPRTPAQMGEWVLLDLEKELMRVLRLLDDTFRDPIIYDFNLALLTTQSRGLGKLLETGSPALTEWEPEPPVETDPRRRRRAARVAARS